MVSLAALGVTMMVGMGAGVFTNAGLASGEIAEKCRMINELEEEIEKVKQQTKELLDKFHTVEDEQNELITKTKDSIEKLKDKIEEMKKQNKNRLDREEYIYFALILTIIIILVTKAILSIFFKEKIK
jgi:peptidoglycan hydrolase CwlO-like protein